MPDSMHYFWCLHCRMNLVGATVDRLCDHVNAHNDRAHVSYDTEWTPENIVASDYYVKPIAVEASRDRAALPQYTEPFGTAKNNHLDRLITADDRKFLAKVLVRW